MYDKVKGILNLYKNEFWKTNFHNLIKKIKNNQKIIIGNMFDLVSRIQFAYLQLSIAVDGINSLY